MATVPQAPNPVVFANVTQTSVTIAFVDNGDGGSPILESQLGYSLNPDVLAENYVEVNAGVTSVINNLSPGRTYYFWVRSRNAVGWSNWSAVRFVTLIAGAYIKVGTEWKRAVPYVNVNGEWKIARGWGRVGGVWKETL